MTQQLWRSLDFDRPESLPIPWCLHGDAAPFTETDSIQVISFRCLLASMPVGDSQLLLAAIPKAAVSKETFNTIMECMAWSFTSLYEGKAPKKNHSSILSPKLLQKEYGTHPLFKVPACSPLAIKLDILHVLDLGVAAYLHGSVLIDIMDKLGGTSRSLATFFALGWTALVACRLDSLPCCVWGGKVCLDVWAGQP